MIIFWRLILGHFIADYTFQTNWMAQAKREAWWGMVLHSVMHPLAFIILTYPFLEEVWFDSWGLRINGWVCVLILFASHYLQDAWRVYTIQNFGTSDSTLHFLWDQLVHFGFIFVLFPYGALVEGRAAAFWFPEKWSVLATLLVVVTHFNTVLVYFLEKDFFGARYPGNDEKYLTMCERVVLSFAMLLPGFWWLPAAAGWAGVGAYARHRRMFEFSWFGYWMGGAIAALSGLAARLLLSV